MKAEFVASGRVDPFAVCGVNRVSGYVNAHLGLREEARLRGAAPDGGDVIIFAMWRQDCRHC